jgi:hypothetical protein
LCVAAAAETSAGAPAAHLALAVDMNSALFGAEAPKKRARSWNSRIGEDDANFNQATKFASLAAPLNVVMFKGQDLRPQMMTRTAA